MRYIALIWDNRDEDIRTIASRVVESATRSVPTEAITSLPGLCVWRPGRTGESTRSWVFSKGGGVVVGTIFEREDRGIGKNGLCKAEATIVQTSGQHLVDRYWGSYIAFIRNSHTEEIHVLRDPSGGIPCFHTVHRGLHLYFSDIKDIMALRLKEFAINWRYIAVNLLVPTLNGEATGLNEVREVCPGECDSIFGTRIKTRAYWQPSQIVTRESIVVPTDAAAELNRICKHCISQWSALDQNILVLLSGGVDSSILLGCTHNLPNPPKITAFTQFVAGRGGADERRYSRQAVQAAGCVSLEHPMNVELPLEYLRKLPHSVRPRVYVSTINDHAIVQAARQAGANAIYNGSGGDALFYKHPELAAADYLSRERIGFRFLKIAYYSALGGGQSFWSVLRAAFANRRHSKLINVIHDSVKNYNALAPKTIEIALDTPQDFLSPWLRDLQHISVGKRDHILGLSLPVNGERPFCSMDGIEERAVLFSQPIIEFLLRVPIDILTAGGLTRSLARTAFVHEVPRPILARNDKGSTRAIAARVLKNNQLLARELLLDGLLVNEGLLDKRQVSRGLSDQSSEVSPSEMLNHLSTEIWLRRWQSSARVSVN